MSEETRRALIAISAEIRKNSARIEKKLAKAGVKPDPALVFSAAQYYRALKKLAKA